MIFKKLSESKTSFLFEAIFEVFKVAFVIKIILFLALFKFYTYYSKSNHYLFNLQIQS